MRGHFTTKDPFSGMRAGNTDCPGLRATFPGLRGTLPGAGSRARFLAVLLNGVGRFEILDGLIFNRLTWFFNEPPGTINFVICQICVICTQQTIEMHYL